MVRVGFNTRAAPKGALGSPGGIGPAEIAVSANGPPVEASGMAVHDEFQHTAPSEKGSEDVVALRPEVASERFQHTGPFEKRSEGAAQSPHQIRFNTRVHLGDRSSGPRSGLTVHASEFQRTDPSGR